MSVELLLMCGPRILSEIARLLNCGRPATIGRYRMCHCNVHVAGPCAGCGRPVFEFLVQMRPAQACRRCVGCRNPERFCRCPAHDGGGPGAGD